MTYPHWRLALSLLLLLMSLCQADIVDFSESERVAKPYSELWAKWAKDGRPQSEQVADIVKDFRGLAATDFIAASSAFITAKEIPPSYLAPLLKELGSDLRRGLSLYNKYVVGLYLHRRKGEPIPTYPSGLPKPGQPWPGLEAEKRPLRVATQSSLPAKKAEPKPVARKPKFLTWEAIFPAKGTTNRQPAAYVGGYEASSDRYLLLGIYRPIDSGPYSGKARDRYVSASDVEANYVSSNPKNYMCPGCEGRQKVDTGRVVSMSRKSNKDRIVVHKNHALKRVDCGYCLGRGWGTLYDIEH